MKQAVADYDFNTYVRALGDFANEDLSAFFFDIRKDSLYCDAATDPKRMAYRTVLDTLFHALVRWAAPVLVFTSEEVWGTRYPEAGSVHLLEWPEIGDWLNPAIADRWVAAREVRRLVNEEVEPLRRAKTIGSSLEAEVQLNTIPPVAQRLEGLDLAELFITAEVSFGSKTPDKALIAVCRTTNQKCGRCWRHLPEVADDGGLCTRCEGVVND